MSIKSEAVEIAKKYLTDDSIETFTMKSGDAHSFRIRIWRGKESTPVVLVSQLPNGYVPGIPTERIANWLMASIFGYRNGMIYAEDRIPYKSTERVLRNLDLCKVFNGPRSRLAVANTKDMEWSAFEKLIGYPVER